jgi:hypothetical protein
MQGVPPACHAPRPAVDRDEYLRILATLPEFQPQLPPPPFALGAPALTPCPVAPRDRSLHPRSACADSAAP